METRKKLKQLFNRFGAGKPIATKISKTPRKKSKRGLIFDHNQAGVIEALMGDPKKYQVLAGLLTIEIAEAERKEDEGLDFATRTEILEKFIESPAFKALDLTLDTPNDYFILGYIFFSVVVSTTAQRTMRDLADPIGRMLKDRKVARA